MSANDPRCRVVHVGPFECLGGVEAACLVCGGVVAIEETVRSARSYLTGDEAQRVQVSRSKQSVLDRAGGATQ